MLKNKGNDAQRHKDAKELYYYRLSRDRQLTKPPELTKIQQFIRKHASFFDPDGTFSPQGRAEANL